MQLDSGRSFTLRKYHTEYTLEGILEGDPDYIRRYVLGERIPKRATRVMGFSKHLVISPEQKQPREPHDPILPPITVMAVLHSSPLDPVDLYDDFSQLCVIWFQQELTGPIEDTVEQAVRSIDWEKHAINGSNC